ncbi:MAG: T9SS type A sorting domain-containing protein [bacterium]|nr:T9SS type A sorting domain-containing protein [Candidatus Kapabacteria bacterium]
MATAILSTVHVHAQGASNAKWFAPTIQEVEIVSDWKQGDAGIIWADDFSAPGALAPRYHDVGSSAGSFGPADAVGLGNSRGLRQHYDSGQVSAGWAWRFFGDHPSVGGPQYREVWARFYHRFDTGFVGVPPKMARMGTFATGDWTLGFMAHYWWATQGSSRGRAIADVASNIATTGNQPVQRGYNNFERWLPVALSTFKADTAPNSERWICYEMRVKLNDANMLNGEYDYWADGQKIISITGRNIVAAYTARGINALQLDTYWNAGSPREQSRFYDNVVIATHRIGPARSPRTPLIRRTPFRPIGSEQLMEWHLQVAPSAARDSIVWVARTMAGGTESVRVDAASGTFTGNRTMLDANTLYVVRASAVLRDQDSSGWSEWHGEFLTSDDVSSIVVEQARSALRAYPSPASERVTIEGFDDGAIEVVDCVGRIVLTERNESTRHRIDVDVSRLASGLYFVRNGAQATRFVVSR